MNNDFAVMTQNNSVNFNPQAAQNFENKQQSYLTAIEVFAEVITASTAAASVVAAADWCIPFLRYYCRPFCNCGCSCWRSNSRFNMSILKWT